VATVSEEALEGEAVEEEELPTATESLAPAEPEQPPAGT
jgi:hypothetical protein